MARRFIVKENDFNIDGTNISVVGDELHHINVLRHKIGDIIQINEFRVKICNISNDMLLGEILNKVNSFGEPKIEITLYQSYLKSDKMELVVQKSVELGVKRIQPFISKNCVVKLDEKDKVKKIERLNKISEEASKQCGRTDIVKIGSIIDVSSYEFENSINANDVTLFAYEKNTQSLKETLEKYNINNLFKIGIIIGPEGGFDEKDLKQILKCENVLNISLGERILRAETASMYILSILSYLE